MDVCVGDSGSVCRGWWRCVEGMVKVCVGNGVSVGMVGVCGGDGDVYGIGGGM